MSNQRSRNWCITINNYSDSDIESLENIGSSYIIIGKEVGESGTPHLQVYCQFKDAKSFSKMKKLLPTAHLEKAKGTPMENHEYCSKDGNYSTLGIISNQGARTDLTELKEKLLQGTTTEIDILLDNPMVYHQYGRTIQKLQDVILRKKFRTQMTTCEWVYGKTGTGKSHYAYTSYNPDTHYNWKNDNGWQDGYVGQETIVINEFRGEIKYANLLELIDWTPLELPRRGREPVPFLAKHIIITSSLRPEQIYRNLAKDDSLDQLYRRITILRNMTLIAELKEKLKSKPIV